MDGRRTPDPKPEKENEPIDEEIIDLKQVIEGGDDDDIIDLNDILEQPDQASVETDDVVIPLEDAIPTQETAAPSAEPDDSIIDLEDVATTLEADIADTQPDVPTLTEAPGAAAAADDEGVIDLLDIAALDTPDDDRPPSPADENEIETAAPSAEPDDSIIDLEDVAATPEAGIADTQPDVPPLTEAPDAAAAADDEGVIDLLDVAALDTPEDEKETAGRSEEPDDSIIDLEDVAATPEAGIADTQPDVPPLTEAPDAAAAADDEGVIDLLDVAALDTPEQAGSGDEELADLESRAEAMLTAATGSTMAPDDDPFGAETAEEAAETSGPDAEVPVLDHEDTLAEPAPKARPAVAVPFSPPSPSEPPEAEAVTPTDQQVEAALERVIEKIYAEKIEQMMIRTIEKTVKREIEKIKSALLEDNDSMAG